MESLQLSVAIGGFTLALASEGKSQHTIDDYRRSLNKFQKFVGGERLVSEISRHDVRAFLASLRGSLAPKSRSNVYVGLSSFWTWAVSEGYAEVHLLRGIKAPRAPAPVIEPFAEEDVQAMIKACARTRSWVSQAGQETSSRRVSAVRDRAILLLLLDTGMRSSELCELRVGDVDLEIGRATIRHAKGGKQRVVYFGKRSRHALWRYWATRSDLEDSSRVIMTVLDGERTVTRDALYRLVRRIGERAGVTKAHPHRFRHTFAISYLRNGGDVFTLQHLLGHSTLDMVRRYARVADSDAERVHQIASPVDNWRL